MFEKYFPFMKTFHVDWLSIRHQFLSMSDSTAVSRMVSPTRIVLVLHLLHDNTSWDLFLMGSICKTYCYEVWKKMSSGYGRLSHLHWVYLSWYWMMYPQHSPMFLFSYSIRGIVPIFSFLHIPEYLWILLELCLCGAFTVSHIVNFFFTIILCGVVKIYLGGLFILFYLTFVIPSFPTLC